MSKFTPTKVKRGSIKDKTGDDFCKSDDEGGKMNECVNIKNDKTGEKLDCKKDKPDNEDIHVVRCKVSSDPDAMEVYEDLPTYYYMDTCYKTANGIKAI